MIELLFITIEKFAEHSPTRRLNLGRRKMMAFLQRSIISVVDGDFKKKTPVTLVTMLGRVEVFTLCLLFSSWSGHIIIHGHTKPEPWLNFSGCSLLGWAPHCSELNSGKPHRQSA